MANDSSRPQQSALAPDSGGVRAWISVYLKGIAMGMADAVPGISGGTIALIAGIYERLIRAITKLDPAVIRLVPRLYQPHTRASFLHRLREMDAFFLVVLGSGMVTAVVSVSQIVEIAVKQYPGPMFAFFFGLIAASAVVLFERRWLATPGRVGAGIAGFGLAFLIAGVTTGGAEAAAGSTTAGGAPILPIVLAAGAVAICGMILPGISGSLILILLGQYFFMIETLNSFIDALLVLPTGTVRDGLVDGILVISSFLAGGVVGVFTIAHVVRWALERYRGATFAFLLGLMIGSLRLPVIEIGKATGSLRAPVLLGVVIAAVCGGVSVLGLDYYSADLDY